MNAILKIVATSFIERPKIRHACAWFICFFEGFIFIYSTINRAEEVKPLYSLIIITIIIILILIIHIRVCSFNIWFFSVLLHCPKGMFFTGEIISLLFFSLFGYNQFFFFKFKRGFGILLCLILAKTVFCLILRRYFIFFLFEVPILCALPLVSRILSMPQGSKRKYQPIEILVLFYFLA